MSGTHELGTSQPNIYQLSLETSGTLYELADQLAPPAYFEQEKLNKTTTLRYQTEMLKIPEVRELQQKMSTDLATRRDARGYIIIDGVPLGKDRNNMTIPTALGTLAGRPFIMAGKNGFWQDLGVNLDAVPYRFQGIGENPFHIDAVNTTNPPDYFTFYGIRHDPQGGGVSVVSNVQNMVSQLTTKEIDYLSTPRWQEGQFYGMTGVGEEYKPFPVLEQRADGLWWVRYTGKMLPDMTDEHDKELFTKIGNLLQRRKESFTLKAGQLLIANQVLLAHGRTPLGPRQKEVPVSKRRYLRQSYIRNDGALDI